MAHYLMWTDETVWTDAELDDMEAEAYASRHGSCSACSKPGCLDESCDCDREKLKGLPDDPELKMCLLCRAIASEDEETDPGTHTGEER